MKCSACLGQDPEFHPARWQDGNRYVHHAYGNLDDRVCVEGEEGPGESLDPLELRIGSGQAIRNDSTGYADARCRGLLRGALSGVDSEDEKCASHNGSDRCKYPEKLFHLGLPLVLIKVVPTGAEIAALVFQSNSNDAGALQFRPVAIDPSGNKLSLVPVVEAARRKSRVYGPELVSALRLCRSFLNEVHVLVRVRDKRKVHICKFVAGFFWRKSSWRWRRDRWSQGWRGGRSDRGRWSSFVIDSFAGGSVISAGKESQNYHAKNDRGGYGWKLFHLLVASCLPRCRSNRYHAWLVVASVGLL